MDRKSPENPEIERLIRIGQASRTCLASEAAALRHKLDVPARIRGSLSQHPSAWLYGSLASGLAASFLFRRRPAGPPKRRGFSRALLGLTLTAARPLAKVWLTGQLKQWAMGAFNSIQTTSSRSNLHNPPSQPNVHSSGPGPR